MNTRLMILKWFLKLSALLQVGYWSASHLFFPQWYFSSIGGNGLIQDDRYALLFMNEIGILTLGVGAATWLASYDPVKDRNIIITLYVVAVGSLCVSLYHILFQAVAPGEWATVIVLLVQLIILTVLSPWKRSAT